jgi:dolichol-phosphate mannosyltransferase
MTALGETMVAAQPHRRRQQVWVVLPAYNEALSLPPLLERLAQSMYEARLPYEVVLVDDGSADGTVDSVAHLAGEVGLRVIRHERNEGLGASLRDGLMKAAELADDHDIVVTMDADNSHTPELILPMVRLVREGNDVVIASRYRAGSRVRGVPWERRLLSFAGRWLFTLLFPTPGVRDYTSGYRAYRAEVLRRVAREYGPAFYDQGGFQAMVDVLLKLRRLDLIFHEVPLILRYDLKEGGSKMKVWKTVRDTLRLLVRRRLGR